MLNYQKCLELFATARNPGAGKPIARNTRILKRGECYAVRLHSTDILTFHADGAVTYFAGGWRTVTTKARMNEYGPARVWSDRGEWIINEAPYAEHCRVLADGSVDGAGSLSDVAAERKLRAQVKRYAHAYVGALTSGKIGPPTNGDCWGCIMRAQNGERPMGGADHILSHMEERYFVPSLAHNAAEFNGMGDAYRFAIQEWEHGREPGDFYGRITAERLPRAIRRFCLKELGLSY